MPDGSMPKLQVGWLIYYWKLGKCYCDFSSGCDLLYIQKTSTNSTTPEIKVLRKCGLFDVWSFLDNKVHFNSFSCPLFGHAIKSWKTEHSGSLGTDRNLSHVYKSRLSPVHFSSNAWGLYLLRLLCLICVFHYLSEWIHDKERKHMLIKKG